MQPELRAIFSHLREIHEVHDGAGFAAFSPAARSRRPCRSTITGSILCPTRAPAGAILGTAAGVLAIFLAAAWLIHLLNMAGLVDQGGGTPCRNCAGLWAAYWLVVARGARPFPTAPNSDLPSVLKGLYLQQHSTSRDRHRARRRTSSTRGSGTFSPGSRRPTAHPKARSAARMNEPRCPVDIDFADVQGNILPLMAGSVFRSAASACSSSSSAEERARSSSKACVPRITTGARWTVLGIEGTGRPASKCRAAGHAQPRFHLSAACARSACRPDAARHARRVHRRHDERCAILGDDDGAEETATTGSGLASARTATRRSTSWSRSTRR